MLLTFLLLQQLQHFIAARGQLFGFVKEVRELQNIDTNRKDLEKPNDNFAAKLYMTKMLRAAQIIIGVFFVEIPMFSIFTVPQSFELRGGCC